MTAPVAEAGQNPLSFHDTLQRPWDATFQAYKEQKIRELCAYPEHTLKQMLRAQQQRPAPVDETGGQLTREILGQAMGTAQASFAPPAVKNILGSASGSGLTDGSPLIRQDLETIVGALFVKSFPLYEMLKKVPGNGLTHAYDVMTTPDPSMTGTSNTISTAITELATVSFTASTYARKTASMVIFGIGRGVSFLEMAAVRGGGMAWDPMQMELAGGVTKIAYDVQTMLFQGNGSYASGTATNEGGLYVSSPAYFDGLRLILGSVSGSNYASNNAVQKEQGALNVTQTVKSLLTQIGQQGGMPDIVVMSMTQKEILDQENENNKRWTDNTVEAVPGVQVNQLVWANGVAKVFAVPGFSQGSYVSPLTGQTVQDIYAFNSDEIEIPWLYAPGITTIELPAAVDYTLSQRYILFQIASLAVKAPIFAGKVRTLYN